MKKAHFLYETYYEILVDDDLDEKQLRKQAFNKFNEGIPKDNGDKNKHDYEISNHTINKDVTYIYGDFEYLYTEDTEEENNYAIKDQKIRIYKKLAKEYLRLYLSHVPESCIDNTLESEFNKLLKEEKEQTEKTLQKLINGESI